MCQGRCRGRGPREGVRRISRPDDELSGTAAYALWEIGLPSSFADWDGLLALLSHRHIAVRAFIANTLADNLGRVRLTSRRAGLIRRAIGRETRERTREVLRGLLDTDGAPP